MTQQVILEFRDNEIKISTAGHSFVLNDSGCHVGALPLDTTIKTDDGIDQVKSALKPEPKPTILRARDQTPLKITDFLSRSGHMEQINITREKLGTVPFGASKEKRIEVLANHLVDKTSDVINLSSQEAVDLLNDVLKKETIADEEASESSSVVNLDTSKYFDPEAPERLKELHKVVADGERIKVKAVPSEDEENKFAGPFRRVQEASAPKPVSRSRAWRSNIEDDQALSPVSVHASKNKTVQKAVQKTLWENKEKQKRYETAKNKGKLSGHFGSVRRPDLPHKPDGGIDWYKVRMNRKNKIDETLKTAVAKYVDDNLKDSNDVVFKHKVADSLSKSFRQARAAEVIGSDRNLTETEVQFSAVAETVPLPTNYKPKNKPVSKQTSEEPKVETKPEPAVQKPEPVPQKDPYTSNGGLWGFIKSVTKFTIHAAASCLADLTDEENNAKEKAN